MKRKLILWSVLLSLAILSASAAVGEGSSPVALLGARGLVVMDQNQLAAMGGEPVENPFEGMTALVYQTPANGETPAIILSWDGALYVAMDMTAMFGGEGAALDQVFYDVCAAYDYDLCVYNDLVYAAQTDAILALMDAGEGAPDMASADTLDTKADFLAAVKAGQ